MGYDAINSGDLIDLVSLVQIGYAVEHSGSVSQSLTVTGASHAARIAYISGSESPDMHRAAGKANVVITMRSFAATRALKTKDRILNGDRVFEIVGIDNSGIRDGVLRFYAVETNTES